MPSENTQNSASGQPADKPDNGPAISADVRRIDDGGPAFPGVDYSAPVMGHVINHHMPYGPGPGYAVAAPNLAPGMSLRDWLAGQALAGQLAGEDMDAPVPQDPGETVEAAQRRLVALRAKLAYMHADAMLVARKERQA